MAKRRRDDVYVRKPKGRQTYTASFWAYGVRYDRGTGAQDRAGAIRIGNEIKEQILGQGPVATSPLKGAVLQWIQGVEKIRSKRWCVVLLQYAKKQWMPRWQTLGDVTSLEIQKYIADRMGSVSSVTVLKELSGLRMFLKWALSAGLISTIPSWVSPRKVTDFQPICLTPEQVKKVLAVMHGDARDYFEFIWETSLRAGTVAAIKWADVDLGKRTLWVRGSTDKNRFARELPLSEGAIAVLQRRVGKDPVFTRKDYRKSIDTAVKKAELELARNPRLHSVRHSRLTDLGGRTTNVLALQYIAGHKCLSTTQQYLHGRLDQAKELIWGKDDEKGNG